MDRESTPPVPERVEDLLRRWHALREPGADPELEAVTVAILLEDVLGITVPDADIDLAVLGRADGVAALLARHGRSR